MPSFGADMEAGVLVEWLVKPGDPVSKDDVVAVIETQKGAIEMEVFTTGVVQALLVEVGTKVPVGTPIALIHVEGESTDSAMLEPALVQPVASAGPTMIPAESPALSSVPESARERASPYAKRLARERGIDLDALTGSGPAGAILAADLSRVTTELTETATRDKRGINASAMRSAIAAAMEKSKREIPHYYLETTIDLQAATDWLSGYNQDRPPEQRILMGALLNRAVALALVKSPELNGFYQQGQYEPSVPVHLGSAIAIRGGGLITPAILNAETCSLSQTMNALMSLSTRVREGGLRSSELSQATITVTSMGDRGVEKVLGVIYPPQVAIVGLGKPVQRPWCINGVVQARTLITVTLAADHRVSDGRQGAKFLMNLDKLLQTPERL